MTYSKASEANEGEGESMPMIVCLLVAAVASFVAFVVVVAVSSLPAAESVARITPPNTSVTVTVLPPEQKRAMPCFPSAAGSADPSKMMTMIAADLKDQAAALAFETDKLKAADLQRVHPR